MLTLVLISKFPVFSTSIRYPEAMFDDCLKSDNFRM